MDHSFLPGIVLNVAFTKSFTNSNNQHYWLGLWIRLFKGPVTDLFLYFVVQQVLERYSFIIECTKLADNIEIVCRGTILVPWKR